MKRFSIYCFYDRDGIVGEYVCHYLRALKKVSDYIYVVVNGSITAGGRQKLLSVADRVDQRENYGLDAYAYRHALQECRDQLKEYDELILSNNSFYGPVYPLEDVFSTMNTADTAASSDFWGITIHPQLQMVINKKQKLDYVNEHVQSYFIVFRKKVFQSRVFEQFFQNLPEIDNFLDAVVLFELELTRVLTEEGRFSYKSYVNPADFPDGNCTISYPWDLYRDGKSPFIKRKVFFEKYHEIIKIKGEFLFEMSIGIQISIICLILLFLLGLFYL